MKTGVKNLFLLFALIVGLGLMPAGRATAQTFTTLYSFLKTYGTNGSGTFINSDGNQPRAGLILSGGTLYGTAAVAGSFASGTVFSGNTSGSGFAGLYNFSALSASSPFGNGDGALPQGGLVLEGNTLYGTALSGGSAGVGTVFKVNTSGLGITPLHSFTALSSSFPYTNSDGYNPYAGLILSNNTLYGTAYLGGSSAGGTVFRVNTDSSGFTNLHSFKPSVLSSNSEGYRPFGGLLLTGNTLYGTAEYGGRFGDYGTVFAVNTDGTGFTNLHSFNYSSDGAHPRGALVLSGNTLYGTTSAGRSSGNGTVFAVNTDGMGFTNLHTFSATSGPYPGTNSDGAAPYAGLILAGNTLYGTTYLGGSSGRGTVFAVNTDSTGFTNLYSFTATSASVPYTNTDGAFPFGGLVLAGDTLYGTSEQGGTGGNGTVFSLTVATVSPPQPPQLTIVRSTANVIVTWPTNATGFTLQSTTNLASPTLWITNSPPPVVVNGQNTVTNPVSGTRKFYRLIQ